MQTPHTNSRRVCLTDQVIRHPDRAAAPSEVADGVLIGMGATILNGARIGSGTLIAAGAVVLEGVEIAPRSLVAGIPARMRRATTDEEVAMIAENTAGYARRATHKVERDQHRPTLALSGRRPSP